MKSAIVLAAGEGRGAWPFAGIRQKVTVPILNVPIVRRLVLDLLALGIEDIVVVIGHRGEAVRSCLGDLAGVRFVEQRALKGPVDATLAGIADVSGEETLVCSGDIVTTRETLKLVMDEFGARNAEALLLTSSCPPEVPHWTSVEVKDGLVSDVWGHGDKNQPRFAGIAAARTETLRTYLLRNPGLMTKVGIGEMPPAEGDLVHSFELMRGDGIEVHAVEAPDFLVDVDRPWQIVEANEKAGRDAMARLESTTVGEGASIDDGADIAADAKLVLGPGAKVGKGCHIGGSLIIGANTQVINGAILGGGVVAGDNTVIKDYCSVSDGCVIGNHSLVSHGAEFTGVMFDVVYLYHYCCITALLGSNVDIGAATVCGTWRFDNGVRSQMVKGHRESPPDDPGSMTYIGDYTRTGVNVMFMPGVKIGYHSCVGAGAIVYEDVPERSLLMAKQEQTTKPWGPEKYGW